MSTEQLPLPLGEGGGEGKGKHGPEIMATHAPSPQPSPRGRGSKTRALILGGVLALFPAAALAQAITVTDTSGHTVRLAQPAQRIVSLAPHLTELLFAAGAGDKIVGTVEFSDWPPAARTLPQVGSFTNVDIEAVAALKPDLVVIWGMSQRGSQHERLTALGIPVWVNDNLRLDDIAATLEIFGQLAGSENTAQAAAQAFRARLHALRQRYAHASKIRVFYQVWNQPLMTINDHDLIGAVIKLCGGENVFGTLGQLAPLISVEAVLAARPDVIIASGMDASRPEWLEDWRRWPGIPAVAANNLFFIPPDIIQRHSPRLIDGATLLCEKLDEARANGNQATAAGGGTGNFADEGRLSPSPP